MKITSSITAVALLVICLLFSGCGNNSEMSAETSMDVENTMETETSGEVEASSVEDKVSSSITKDGVELELNEFGRVTFQVIPANNNEAPTFVLKQEGKTIYTFPKTQSSSSTIYERDCNISIEDYNGDGELDVIVLLLCSDGENQWMEPQLFIQNNADNMIFLDYPELNGYIIHSEAKEGNSFYRDTLLEEYLMKQRLANSIEDIEGSWVPYLEYLDGLFYGFISPERQIEIYANQRESWMEELEFADEIYSFALADMNCNGNLELIVSNYGGTGHYTYSRFFHINEEQKVTEIESTFQEGDSQPDMIREEFQVYSDFTAEGSFYYYIVQDDLKAAADTYVNRISALSLQDERVVETVLASQTITYENSSSKTVCKDKDGNIITQDEYDNIADTIYGKAGMTKSSVALHWIDIKDLKNANEKSMIDKLAESWKQYQIR